MSEPARPLQGQVVLVTGGGAGIGAATAHELARRGAHPVLFDRDAAALQATAASIGHDVLAVAGDTTVEADLERAVALARARHGGIDIAWANAGIASFGPLAHTDPQAWLRTLEVNVVGVFRTVRAALPALVERRGLLAVTASAASFAHPPGLSAYAASKAAVEAMCDAWRIELAQHGVGVTAIHPSWISTPMVAEADEHPAFRALVAAMPAPMRQRTSPEATARSIADGFERRARRVFVPGWLRAVFALRSILHTRPGERDLLRAAPEVERLFVAEAATRGAAAASITARAPPAAP